ncbi:MAG: hypothetical protein OR994_03005 [Candidatus Poseidoniales archaeon]|jgi:hypothetical protein|uniref:DUF4190 domain-containing protein n=1 Tax=uncultured marine group II/III euryarchaeote SAT1000_09_G02 TaxID=1456557 RepID=A0A075I1S2_9EURY|nr:hypothetical protein [uncultured marine group II/III euryarchaeote SAT1000_09_G02]MDE0953623.1 hypothetical protein [Candidatus Poseidoniales archaeon]|tara:strand:- start:3185 stop:3532 length:348 start_codon:yes stop_codon:yes gene_type:complete
MSEESEIPWANPGKNAGSTVQVSGHPMGQYTTTNATLALVLAAVSWFLCGICTAIPAVILANGALAITNSQPGHPDQGLAKAAQILGWVNIVVVGLIIIGYILLIAVVIGVEASG